MPDRGSYAARGYTLASNLREKVRAVAEKQPSELPPKIAPNASRLRPANAVSCVAFSVEKVVDVLVSQGGICDV